MLKEILAFLDANPSEIVTIFIEDYVTSPSGLSKVFDAAGLKKYLFPIARMPNDGKDWPTVDDMAKNNQRLVVFTSKSSKEASEGIAYEWNYVVENQCESSIFFIFFFKIVGRFSSLVTRCKYVIQLNSGVGTEKSGFRH